MARPRVTAAAYGFSSWDVFRKWPRDNPSEYRKRSRELTDEQRVDASAGDVTVDLLARLPRRSARADGTSGGDR
jgi:hypothetical protein